MADKKEVTSPKQFEYSAGKPPLGFKAGEYSLWLLALPSESPSYHVCALSHSLDSFFFFNTKIKDIAFPRKH